MILDIIENVPMLIIPAYLVYLIIRTTFRFRIQSHRESTIEMLKFLFCLGVTILIITSIMIIIMMEILEIGTIWNEYEVEHQVEPWIKSVCYATIEFVWSLIAVILSHTVFKNIYFKQIISGEGTVKQRISQKWQRLKADIKEGRERCKKGICKCCNKKRHLNKRGVCFWCFDKREGVKK